MIIYPAIDILGGRAVRLTKGDYATAKTYAADPTLVAADFRKRGATHLHVVDLDGAKSGKTENAAALESAIKAFGGFVQTGGGIRSESRIEQLLELGVGRVVLGTAAVRDPEFLRSAVKAFGERIAVGVDAVGGMVAVDGWTSVTREKASDFVHRLASEGVKTVVYTDISRDGTLGGVDSEFYRSLKDERIDIIASGGVGSLSDVTALAAIKVDGAIIGKALYEGKFTIEQCLAIGEQS